MEPKMQVARIEIRRLRERGQASEDDLRDRLDAQYQVRRQAQMIFFLNIFTEACMA